MVSEQQSADLNEQSRQIWNANAEAWDSRMNDGGNSWQVTLIQPTVVQLLDIQPGQRVLEEPPAPSPLVPERPLDWANFDAPPLLFARLCLPK